MTIELRPKTRKWVFQDILGDEHEANVPSNKDPEALCCELTWKFGNPYRCFPKIIESSSGMNRGEIII